MVELVRDYLFPNEPTRFSSDSLDLVLLHAVHLQASDITFQTQQPVLAEIYGRLFALTQRRLSHAEVSDLLNVIYGANGTTQIYSGKDVDTHYEIKPNRSERYRFRVNGTGCLVEGHDGLQITVRTIPTTPPALVDLNLEPEILAAMSPEQGTVIVTGPTGSGKSTLLAAMIRHIVEDGEAHRKVLTYESPIEFVYDNVEMPSSVISQSEIPRHLPSFAGGVRNALRRKPGLILVGEARDPETIAAVIDAALTGHPVYTTLHSNGVADAVRRMVSIFPGEERHGRALDILETLRLIIWQRLVRTKEGQRVPIREFLVFTETIRDALIATDIERLAAHTRQCLRQYGQPMQVDVERKYKAGALSERDYRVLSAQSRLQEVGESNG